MTKRQDNEVRPLYLNGGWVKDGEPLQVVNPATGEPFAKVATINRAVYHDIRDFIARVLANLSRAGQIDFRNWVADMTIVACQTHSALNNDMTIVYVN